MSAEENIFCWKQLPDRDQALEVVYRFVRALGEKKPEEAATQVVIRDIRQFVRVLHDSLLQYLEMVIEDEDWDDYEGRNLALELTDPSEIDEDISQPEFSGNNFEMEVNESVSMQIGLRGQITPIRLQFTLVEADALYFLKLSRITAQ